MRRDRIFDLGRPGADLHLARMLRAMPFARRLDLLRESRGLAQDHLKRAPRRSHKLLLRFYRNMVTIGELR